MTDSIDTKLAKTHAEILSTLSKIFWATRLCPVQEEGYPVAGLHWDYEIIAYIRPNFRVPKGIGYDIEMRVELESDRMNAEQIQGQLKPMQWNLGNGVQYFGSEKKEKQLIVKLDYQALPKNEDIIPLQMAESIIKAMTYVKPIAKLRND